MKRLTLAGGVLVAAFCATACSDKTGQKAREAGQHTAEAAKATGETVESAAQDAVDKVQRASNDPSVKEAEQSARDAVNDAAAAAAAGVETAKVKSALIADSSVDAGGIDVDTDAHTKVITLKGHVPSAAQKSAAWKIAAAKASTGYTVRNELEVRR